MGKPGGIFHEFETTIPSIRPYSNVLLSEALLGLVSWPKVTYSSRLQDTLGLSLLQPWVTK